MELKKKIIFFFFFFFFLYIILIYINKMKNILLYPFKKYFYLPNLNIQIKFISWPNNNFIQILFFLTFLICSSGFIYCFVNGSNFYGYSLSETRDIVVSLIELNSFDSQFLLESYIILIFSTFFSLSFFCFYFLFKNNNLTLFKKILFRIGIYLSPLWLFILMTILAEKCTDYWPGFLITNVQKKQKFKI